MGLGKNGYYSSADIKKVGAQYNIVLGERSPGKSYEIKAECLLKAYEQRKPTFIIIRRLKEDIRQSTIQSYFDDNNDRRDGCKGDVYALTNGEYNYIDVYNGRIYFANRDEETFKITRGMHAGYVMALALDERYKGGQYPSVTDIVYEEFVTNKVYLRNEPTRLQNLVSTICRDKEVTVWMIANTISRVCPYFQEWGLQNIPRMKSGEIDTYKLVGENDTETTIAVEFAPSRKRKNRMFFGNASRSIQGGAWETKEVAHLPDDYEKFDLLYEMLFNSCGFTFAVQLLMDDDGVCFVYVYPHTKQNTTGRRVITSEFSLDPDVSNTLRQNRPEKLIGKLIAENKICYATNLCGSDFIACVKNMSPPPFMIR